MAKRGYAERVVAERLKAARAVVRLKAARESRAGRGAAKGSAREVRAFPVLRLSSEVSGH
jgi:hypothetical protein